MKFKDDRLREQYLARPARLREVCQYFAALCAEYGKEAVVTRVTDPVEGESGVHPQGRAVDFRNEVRDGGGSYRLFTDAQVKEIVQRMNERFPRADKYLTCLHHSFKGGAFHFHCQIPASWA